MSFEEWYAEVLEWAEDFPQAAESEGHWRGAHARGLSADQAWDEWWNA